MKHRLVMFGKMSEYLIYAFLISVLFIILSPRLPTKNFVQTFIVPTGSMYPAVIPGSVAFVNPEKSNFKKGDVIAFTRPDDSYETVLHRIKDITKEGYITKGDNNNIQDNWIVTSNLIKGKLIFSIPYLGHVAAFVKKPVGFVILALVPSLLLVVSFLADVKEGINEEINKRKKHTKLTRLISLAFVFVIFGAEIAQSQLRIALASFASQTSISGMSFVFDSQTPTPTVIPSPTPTISPTPTPTGSPLPSPTNNPGNCQDLDVVIEGNGAGSVNSVLIKCIKETVIVQFNELHNTNNINYNFHYDSNQGPQGVLGDIHLDGESTIVKDLFMGSCSSKSCVANSEIKNKKLKIKFS